MEIISGFVCSACGKCCSRISMLYSGPDKFLEEYGYGKLPLIKLNSPNKMTFPLWDFEAERFKEYAQEKNIDSKIFPSSGVFDLNSNRFIIFSYHIDSRACPFLDKNGKCIIYNRERALVCKLFPFNKTPFLKDGENNSVLFGDCDNIMDIVKNLDYKNHKSLIKQLHESFGDTFLAAVQQDFIMEWSNKLIIELMKKKKLRPALNYPYGLLLKRINNSKKIDLTEFLVEIGYMTKKQIDDLIKRFENFEDAKGKIAKS